MFVYAKDKTTHSKVLKQTSTDRMCMFANTACDIVMHGSTVHLLREL